MNISTLAPVEALEAVTAMETVEQLREAATSIGLKFSGNTGEATLRKNLIEAINAQKDSEGNPPVSTEAEPEKEEFDFGGPDTSKDIIEPTGGPAKKGPTIAEMLEMDPNEITDPQLLRQVVRAKALRLRRIRVTNLDPADSQLNGGIFTALNKFTGKISKYVPFGDEEAPNGYHLPQILVTQLENQKFPLRKEIKGGQFGVKRYKTTMINKFSIEFLPELTEEDRKDLAAHQRASHAID